MYALEVPISKSEFIAYAIQDSRDKFVSDTLRHLNVSNFFTGRRFYFVDLSEKLFEKKKSFLNSICKIKNSFKITLNFEKNRLLIKKEVRNIKRHIIFRVILRLEILLKIVQRKKNMFFYLNTRI